jgi:hypothetical protein
MNARNGTMPPRKIIFRPGSEQLVELPTKLLLAPLNLNNYIAAEVGGSRHRGGKGNLST